MFNSHTVFVCKAVCIYILLSIVVLSQTIYACTSRSRIQHVTSFTPPPSQSIPPSPDDIQLDSHLPVQFLTAQSKFTNVNARFGSRFNFTISTATSTVYSGTDGTFHDNAASYIVGVSPAGQHRTFIFHMGKQNSSQGDSYALNERWIQGLDTTRWIADTTDNQPLRMIVDVIDPFQGEPGCTAIVDCAASVKDDTLPIFIIGVSLQNFSTSTQQGKFLFGSNRKLATHKACEQHITPDGTPVALVSYDQHADATGGTLFMAGDLAHWDCNTSTPDRTGLFWNYSIAARQTRTAYLILGGWNGSHHLFANTMLPAGCQNEDLYAATEWSSPRDVADYALDNLATNDHLLASAQAMENFLVYNRVLSSAQRWLIGNSLRSYKADSWLLARRECAGGGYDAAVYEGTYGFLNTVDVMHEYSYFEITRVPWFFKAAMSTVFANRTRNAFGLYFQHDQGGNIDSSGHCTLPGQGLPTLRSSCYAPPYIAIGTTMPTEENDDVALLMSYYEYATGDTAFLSAHIDQLNAAMAHNLTVGDPHTGIAYHFQDTATTYDAASDCLHNAAPGAGNLYYQGLQEASAYLATAYLDSLVNDSSQQASWTHAADQIEDAMLQEYKSHGFLPIAHSNAFSNCDGRSIASGDGLFYLYLSGQERSMNQELLADLAHQFPADLQADTLTSPSMIAMASTRAEGTQCSSEHCLRYTWFSKVILASLVASFIYTRYGCSTCSRLDLVQAAYNYNKNSSHNFSDGFHEDSSDWGGHLYPRGIISWAFLNASY